MAPAFLLSSQSGVSFWFPLPPVLSTLCFVLCLVCVAVGACSLTVGEVEFGTAFGDGHDVVGLVGAACASWAVDLAVLVSCLDGAFPCGLL